MITRKALLTLAAALCTAALGFSETYVVKTGKITALNLDPATKQTTVTVTLGDLQLPTPNARGKKPAAVEDFIALSNETQSFALTDDVVVELYHPLFTPKPVAKDADTSDEDANADEALPEAGADAANADGNADPRRNERARDGREGRFNGNRAPNARPAAPKAYTRVPNADAQGRWDAQQRAISLGSIVQLIFAEDGTTVRCIQVVPELPFFAPAAQKHANASSARERRQPPERAGIAPQSE